MKNDDGSFLKKIFGGSSVVGTIVSGLIVGMIVQWLTRKKSAAAGDGTGTLTKG